MLHLDRTGPDEYLGTGPQYPWGGLYGGQIVAHALEAAADTVPDGVLPHSLRAYFLRPGDAAAPVAYEVDRLRDGRSFTTRRVVARQAIGAILNLEASFTAGEASLTRQLTPMPDVPAPDALGGDAWSDLFERRFGPAVQGSGRCEMWLRWTAPIDDDPLSHLAAIAYLSDDVPAEAIRTHLDAGADDWFVSLDHTIWFHAVGRADEWQLHAFRCDRFVAGRGLAIGEIFTASGTHVATVAQEMLFRRKR